MADAVSLVALGLSTCKFLVRFYQNHKGYLSEVEKTYAELKNLEGYLEEVQELLEKCQLGQKRKSKQLEECLADCRSAIESLAKEAERTCYKQDHIGPKRKRVIARISYALRPGTYEVNLFNKLTIVC